MDVIALASVISSGTVGLASVAATLWNARRPVQVAREQRTADAYLQILEIMERHALWLVNIEHNSSLDHYEVEIGAAEAIKNPRPERSDRAKAAALLSAHGSKRALGAYKAWRNEADRAENHIEAMSFDATENYPHGPDDALLKRFKEEFRPQEVAARERFADVVQEELGR
ncbi:hypothetical protein [Actinomycetospora sp. CA-053990]|uniref:hypothetical protein n=1 Tax=Actinomycetospora sp. CA-053990 TaxID=3239891 RepID=UPI003D8BF793